MVFDPQTKRMITSSLDGIMKQARMYSDAVVLAKMKKHKTLVATVLNTPAHTGGTRV